jgi:AcrR family transcriptional regulator
VLRDAGADGATLRAIAERAGVSLGIVYRRFPDKDTVLRAVYMRYFERIGATNVAAIADPRWAEIPTADLGAHVIRGLSHGYQLHRPLLRALHVYAMAHEDVEFKRRADAANSAALDGVALLFERRVVEIRHPDPTAAIHFALRAVGAVLQQRLIFDPRRISASERETLEAEAVRMFLSYLGVEMTKVARGAK